MTLPAPDGWVREVARSGAGYYTISYPENWNRSGLESPYYIKNFRAESPDFDQFTDLWVKLDIFDDEGLYEATNSEPGILPGTVTSTIISDGKPPAVRHDPAPNLESDGPITQFAFTDVPRPPLPDGSPDEGFSVYEYLNNAPDEAALEEVHETTRGIAASIQFIENHLREIEWDSTDTQQSGLPGVCWHIIDHPVSWTVSEAGNTLLVHGPQVSPFTAGPIDIAIDVTDEAAWERGSDMLGLRNLRRLSPARPVEGNRVEVELVKSHVTDHSLRMVVTVPQLPIESDDYWLYDQIVLGVIGSSAIALEDARHGQCR